MTNSKNKPLYRVNFAPITGSDADGQNQLARSIEIGVVWPLKDPAKGAILKLDIVPQNLANGVLFLNPIADQAPA